MEKDSECSRLETPSLLPLLFLSVVTAAHKHWRREEGKKEFFCLHDDDEGDGDAVGEQTDAINSPASLQLLQGASKTKKSKCVF